MMDTHDIQDIHDTQDTHCTHDTHRVYLLKLGELTLKGGNRSEFERILKRNIVDMLCGVKAKVEITQGRFFIRCEHAQKDAVERVLSTLFGISGWALAAQCEKTPEAVAAACVAEGRALFESGAASFKVEARRTDKRFPLDSYGIMAACGEKVLEAVPQLKVDVHRPDAVIHVEIREKGFVYGKSVPGLGGLPVGTAGRGLLLLSGGIDSPVAGYLTASRGMRLDAVYFHAFPYTSEEARLKALTLAEIVGRYAMGIRLWTIGFTAVEQRLKERAPEAWRTVLLRMAMMECAERLARRVGGKCLVTGESLSQVASQTIENIQCTQSRVSLPVLRPLIGFDKGSIVRLAEKIGTYATSILPYEDCCVLFSPLHPVLRGSVAEASALYESLELDTLLAAALYESGAVKRGYPRSEGGNDALSVR